MRRGLLALLVLAAAAEVGSRVGSAPQEPVEQIVIGGVTPRFAVPECLPRTTDERTQQACRTITQVLRNDLRFARLFQFVPDSLLTAVPPLNPDAPVFEDWQGIGAAAVLLLLAIGVIFYLRYRRRPSELIPEPPHEIAFSELDALRATDFADPEAVHRFHFALSEILRTYVEGRYGLNATDLTTDEILFAMPRFSELGKSDGQSLQRFLVDTDHVKFADHHPNEPEIEANYERALGFVEATQPKANEEEAA